MFTEATTFTLFQPITPEKEKIFFFPEKFLSTRSSKIYKNVK